MTNLGSTTSSAGGGLKLGAGSGGLQLGGHSTTNTGLGGLGLAKCKLFRISPFYRLVLN